MLLFLLLAVTLITLIFVVMFSKFQQSATPAIDGNVYCCFEDDSDMKIAGREPKEDTGAAVITEVNALKIQRENGNVDKANRLGAELCGKFIDKDGISAFGSDKAEPAVLTTQRRLLLAFAVDTTVENTVKNSILRDVIIKSFYDNLKMALPSFYEDLNKSGSFSFYTLCVRRGVDIEKYIGDTFAMLAGKEGDKLMAEFGKALYLEFIDVINKTVNSYNFI